MRSPSLIPWASASLTDISTHTSGAAVCNCGTRPALVLVMRMKMKQSPAGMRNKGDSSVCGSCGGSYSAALVIALLEGFMARYSVGSSGAPVTRSLP